MEKRKSLTVHYRRFDDPTGSTNGTTLEACIRAAMANQNGEALSDHWNRRAWSVPPGDTDTLLMNLYHDDGQGFFGDLTVYTHGFMQALLHNEQDVPILRVEQQLPPKGREYIHSMMFWLVIDNHVMAIHSRSLSTKHLEQYLTWLLKDQTNQLDKNGHVILTAKFDSEEVGGELDDIQEIIIGGTGAVQAAPDRLPHPQAIEREVDKHVDVDEHRSWGQRARNILKIIMNNDADVQKLLDSIPKEADLNVSVRIGYKTKSRRVSRAPMQEVLRNLPDGDIKARGKHGKLTGKDIRLSYPVRVISNGSLYDPEDVRSKLRSAYDYFVENGKIDT